MDDGCGFKRVLLRRWPIEFRVKRSTREVEQSQIAYFINKKALRSVSPCAASSRSHRTMQMFGAVSRNDLLSGFKTLKSTLYRTSRDFSSACEGSGRTAARRLEPDGASRRPALLSIEIARTSALKSHFLTRHSPVGKDSGLSQETRTQFIRLNDPSHELQMSNGDARHQQFSVARTRSENPRLAQRLSCVASSYAVHGLTNIKNRYPDNDAIWRAE